MKNDGAQNFPVREITSVENVTCHTLVARRAFTEYKIDDSVDVITDNCSASVMLSTDAVSPTGNFGYSDRVADRLSSMKKTIAGVQRYTFGRKSAIAGVQWQTFGRKSAIAGVQWQTFERKSAIAGVQWQTFGRNAPTAEVQRFKNALNGSRAGRLQLNKENIIIHF